MSIVIDSYGTSTSSTSSTVIDPQSVESVIHITLDPGDPPTLRVSPRTVEAYYTHHGGGGDELRPHRLLWMAMFKREPGVKILIRLMRVDHPDQFPLSDPKIERAFRGKPSYCPARTWVIEHDQNAVETDPIALPTDWYGRINFKYDVVLKRFEPDLDLDDLKMKGIDLNDRGKLIAQLDPGGNLIPDP
jgi:hypothetical protein